jgi:hypothetical protein
MSRISIQVGLATLKLDHLIERRREDIEVVLLSRLHPRIKALARLAGEFLYKFRRELFVLFEVFLTPL